MGLEWGEDSEYPRGKGKPPQFGPGFIAMVMLVLLVAFIIWQTK